MRLLQVCFTTMRCGSYQDHRRRGGPLATLLLLLVTACGCESVSSEWTRAFDLYPNAVRFTRSSPGSHSVEAVVLSNRADRPLSFEARLEPKGAGFDASWSTCTRPLPIGEECAVFVTFSPVEVGDYQQRLCVRAQETESCVSLTGLARASSR